MVDRKLLQRLHDKRLIDERNVLWWQFGYEGRHIYSEEEFSRGLDAVRCAVEFDPRKGPLSKPEEREFRLWMQDDVPILIRNVLFGRLDVPCFISVKPRSHGWVPEDAHDVYYTPHVRGAVIEATDRHLFWYPFGTAESDPRSEGRYLKRDKMWCILHPVPPGRFYKKIITNGWGERRWSKKRPTHMRADLEGYSLVPYYKFDTDKQQIMIYPVPLFEHSLDSPVIVKTTPQWPKVEVLGMGYADILENGATHIYYWPLQKPQVRKVRENLEWLLSTGRIMHKAVVGRPAYHA